MRPENTGYLVPVYLVYGGAALALTVWLARTLFRNGAVFLADVFEAKAELASAVNRLLVTGFFMLNLGYAFFLLRADDAATATEAIEILARKLGVLLLTLAVVHFVNVAVFWRLRSRHALDSAEPWIATAPPVAVESRRVTPPPPPAGPATI